MRVTQRMITNKTINVLQQGMSNVARAQEQVYSGVKINRLSDDPAGLSQTMAIQRNLSLNYQFQRNIKDGIGWLDQTDTALLYGKSSVLAVARDLAERMKNGIYEGGNRLDAANEIDSLINALLDQAANASLGDKYLFGGLKNNVSPFIRIGDNFIFRGDTSDVLRRIASGSDGVCKINASGYDVFYNKLVNLTKAAGSQITDVNITSKQNTVSSFGAIDLSGPLYGKMVLNIDGVQYTVQFDGEQTEDAVRAKINTALRNTNAVAGIDAKGVLTIGPRDDSKYKDFSINVVSLTDLNGLNMVAGFNTLQYGKYRLSTVEGVSPGNATALVTDYYSQVGNTILGNVGVADNNNLNSSVLMEVLDVKYTNERAEITSSDSLNKVTNWDNANGKTLVLEIDGTELTVPFDGFDDRQDLKYNKDNLVSQLNAALEGNGKAYIDGEGELTISSNSTGTSSKIQIKNIFDVDGSDLTELLNMQVGQSGAVGVEEVTVKFSYNTYDKEGKLYQGAVVQTFKDTRTDIIDPNTGTVMGTDSKDGIPNFPETVTLGDGVGHNIELSINLTRFVRTGDKAVITVTAQADSGNAGIGVNYDGKDRNWVFNNGKLDNKTGFDLKFFTLDEGNGESYDGNIYFATNGEVSTISEAVTFTAGNVFDALVYMRKKLENDEQAKMDTCMDAMDEYINNFLSTLVTIGARARQFEDEYYNYAVLEVNLQSAMDTYYSADFTTAMVRYQDMLDRLEASMSTCSSILGLSLLKYLK